MNNANENLSKVPVDSLTPENLDALKTQPRPPVAETRKRNLLPFFIGGAVLLIAVVAVVLFFVLRKPSEEAAAPEAPEGDLSEVIWEPDPESENAVDDYIAHQQETIDNSSASSDDVLDAKLSIANIRTVEGKYSEAESLLNEIERSSLTHRQLFNLYSAYTYLYNQSGDSASYDEYNALVDEVLNQFWDEEEVSNSESASAPAQEESGAGN